MPSGQMAQPGLNGLDGASTNHGQSGGSGNAHGEWVLLCGHGAAGAVHSGLIGSFLKLVQNGVQSEYAEVRESHVRDTLDNWNLCAVRLVVRR